MTSFRIAALLCLMILLSSTYCLGFAPLPRMKNAPRHNNRFHDNHHVQRFLSTPEQDNNDEAPSTSSKAPPPPSTWNPFLRRIMGSVATLGVLETSYLTYTKLFKDSFEFCSSVGGGCNDVLNGPYSVLPFTNIPLAAFGLCAYTLTALLAEAPILTQEDDSNNRILLLSLTTAMATFSVFLISLLSGVLHTSCPWCVASACFSITLASIAWLGGCLPTSENKVGVQAGVGSFVATTVAAVAFFFSVDPGMDRAHMFPTSPTDTTGTLLASTSSSSTQQQQPQLQDMMPPPITTISTKQALDLSVELQHLNSKMYGAYWCSHCYDQKQSFGRKAFMNIKYVECSPEGKNSETPLCKERDVPGYPTWEIDGKLYPGERDLQELEELVKEITTGE